MNRISAYVLFGIVALGSGVAISLYRATPETPPPVAKTAEGVLVDHPLAGLDGSTRTLRDWEGTTLLVNFWATWCAPCREEIPMLQEASDRYRDRNFAVVGIAFDEEKQVAAFRDEIGIRYPLLLALEDPFSLLGLSGNDVGGLPHSVLLDGRGKILAAHTGILTRDQLEDLLQTHLEL